MRQCRLKILPKDEMRPSPRHQAGFNRPGFCRKQQQNSHAPHGTAAEYLTISIPIHYFFE
jgi:hypothetical protein